MMIYKIKLLLFKIHISCINTVYQIMFNWSIIIQYAV